MDIIPFKACHLRHMQLQDAQVSVSAELDNPDYGAMLETGSESFTGTVDGRIIGCAGIVRFWHGRAMIWALLSPECGRHFVAIHRAVQDKLASLTEHRIEAFVNHDFTAGIRWIEMLGFQREGLMRKYTPDGKDCYLYSRVK